MCNKTKAGEHRGLVCTYNLELVVSINPGVGNYIAHQYHCPGCKLTATRRVLAKVECSKRTKKKDLRPKSERFRGFVAR